MELKVVCDCGQKYKFDVEPANGQMPYTVNCPTCGVDGTPSANASIAMLSMPIVQATVAEVPALAPAIQPGGLKINRPPPPPSPVASASLAPSVPPPIRPTNIPATPKYQQKTNAPVNNNFMLGILGGIIGAAVGVACMYGFFLLTHLRMPLTGTLVGAATGYGARLMYKGTSSSLGGVCAAIALITIPSTLYLMFGPMAMAFGLISIIIGVGMAFRIASA